MDYSQFSNDDLMHIKSGNFTKMSDQGLMAYKQIKQASQQAQQQAGPQPYTPASNIDKQGIASGKVTQDPMSRAPDANKSSIRQAADMATAGALGIGKGAALGYSRTLQPWEQDAVNEHPTVNKIGQAIGNIVPSSAVGAGVKAATAGMGGIARILGMGAGYAAKGAAQNPEEGQSRPLNALMGSAVGMGSQGLAEGIKVAPEALKALISPEAQDKAAKWGMGAATAGLFKGDPLNAVKYGVSGALAGAGSVAGKAAMSQLGQTATSQVNNPENVSLATSLLRLLKGAQQ